MNDTTEELTQPKARHRARQLTVAGLVTIGLATGGVVAANAATTSGGGSSDSGGGSSASAPAAPKAGPAMNGYGIDGYVTSVSSSRLTVRDLFGNSKTYALSSATTYHAGPGTKTGTSSPAVGQHVMVRATKSGSTLKAVDVDIHAAHLNGRVVSVADDVVTITDADGFTRKVMLASGTTYTKDGRSSTRSIVTAGVVINAEGKVDTDGTTLDASKVDVLTKAPTPPAGPAAGGPGGIGGPGRNGPGANGGKAPAGAPSGGKAPSGAPSGGKAPASAPSGAPSAPAGSSAPTSGNSGHGS